MSGLASAYVGLDDAGNRLVVLSVIDHTGTTVAHAWLPDDAERIAAALVETASEARHLTEQRER